MYAAPLALALPFTAAGLLAAGSRILPRRVADLASILTAGATTALCLLLLARSLDDPSVVWTAGRAPVGHVALTIPLYVDPLSAAFTSLAALLITATFTYAWHYFDTVGAMFHALVLVFLGGMIGFTLTGDLFNLFVFLEVMSVAAYALTGYKIEARSLQGAIHFAVTNTIGAFLILAAIALLYARTGALNIAQVGASLGAGAAGEPIVITAFALLVIGLFVKADIAPFHFWLADAHALAPTPICAVFSGVMVQLGLYAVARLAWTLFLEPLAGETDALRAILLGFGALTTVVGALLCFINHNLKRLLAFSTVSHSGIFLLGLALLSTAGLAGMTLYAVAHGLVKAALFFCTGVVLHRLSSVDELELHGRGRAMPLTGVVMAVAALALAGLPPFTTHGGKALIDAAAHELHIAWLPWLVLGASALTGAAVLRASGRIFLGWGAAIRERGSHAAPQKESEEEEQETEGGGGTPVFMIAPAVALLALALGLHWVPDLEHLAMKAAAYAQAERAYTILTLGGEWTGVAVPDAPRTGGTLRALATIAAAIALALAVLFRFRLSESARRLSAAAWGPAADALKRVHSGTLADYVTWLMIGAAVLSALFALALR